MFLLLNIKIKYAFIYRTIYNSLNGLLKFVPNIGAQEVTSCGFNDQDLCDFTASGTIAWSFSNTGTPSSETGPNGPQEGIHVVLS